MWKGHRLYTVGNGRWVFDLTEYTGYKANIDKDGKLRGCSEAFRVKSSEEGAITFECNAEVPVQVLRRVKDVVMTHEEMVGGCSVN